MDSSILEKVLAYIDAHIHEKINLSDLSEVACYSPFYFSKLFSESMGMPVTGYIRIRKLQYAIASLLEGQKVLDVALLQGGRVKITDNGRGLPLSKDLHASKAVLDKVLSGSPITNAEYSQMGDLIPAGLQTVNSLCEELQVIVRRDRNQFQQNYIRGIAQHDLTISDMVCASGTKIILKPDMAIFGDTTFSQELLDNWLKDRATDMVNLKVDVFGSDNHK